MKLSILLCNSTKWWHGPGEFVIREVEGVDFSHVAIKIVAANTEYVFDSTWPKSKKQSMSEFLQHYSIRKEYGFEVQESELEVFNFLMSLTGKVYPISQLVFIYLRRISSYINKISKGWILNHEKGLICSEYGARVMSKYLGSQFKSDFDSVGLVEIKNECERLKCL